MRMRNKPWALDYLMTHSDIADVEMTHAKDVAGFFGNKQDLHIEVGTGMGTFITTLAAQNPDINYLGIELDKNILIRVVEKVIDNDLKNVKVVLLDARELNTYFNASEVDRIYLNFSDPWPKNRHEKRRLTHHNFLVQYEDILKNDGEVHFKTDNKGLFEYSLVSLNNYGMIFEDINLDLHMSEPSDNIRTEYEEKFSSRGNLIRQLKASFK
jgi:tRNA (guanine-N7-)-methyltransferase